MTRLVLVAGACALAVAGTAAAGQGTGAGKQASLSAIDLRPLVVRGAGFEPGEQVRLMAASGEGQQWRAKVADPRGVLTARFGMSIGPCGRFSVFAVGSRGSRARIFPLRAQIACVSPNRAPETTRGDLTT
jgi:hypothetical protein